MPAVLGSGSEAMGQSVPRPTLRPIAAGVSVFPLDQVFHRARGSAAALTAG